MPKLNQRGFAPVIVLVLLLAGIVGGVYLVQNYTNLLPKANVTPEDNLYLTQKSLNDDTLVVQLSMRADLNPMKSVSARVNFPSEFLSLSDEDVKLEGTNQSFNINIVQTAYAATSCTEKIDNCNCEGTTKVCEYTHTGCDVTIEHYPGECAPSQAGKAKVEAPSLDTKSVDVPTTDTKYLPNGSFCQTDAQCNSRNCCAGESCGSKRNTCTDGSYSESNVDPDKKPGFNVTVINPTVCGETKTWTQLDAEMKVAGLTPLSNDQAQIDAYEKVACSSVVVCGKTKTWKEVDTELRSGAVRYSNNDADYDHSDREKAAYENAACPGNNSGNSSGNTASGGQGGSGAADAPKYLTSFALQKDVHSDSGYASISSAGDISAPGFKTNKDNYVLATLTFKIKDAGKGQKITLTTEGSFLLNTLDKTDHPNASLSLTLPGQGATAQQPSQVQPGQGGTGLGTGEGTSGSTNTAAQKTKCQERGGAAYCNLYGNGFTCNSTDLGPNGDGCTKISTTPVANETNLNVPTLSTGAYGLSTVQLKWNKVTGATSYKIHYKTPFGPEVDGPVAEDQQDIIVDQLSPSTPYIFWINACNSTGCSKDSNKVTATTLTSPGDTTLSNDTQIDLIKLQNPTTVTVFWTDSLIGSHTVFYKDPDGVQHEQSRVGDFGGMDINNLKPGDYQFWVRFCKGNGACTKNSEIYPFTVPAPKPTITVNGSSTATVAAGEDWVLSWSGLNTGGSIQVSNPSGEINNIVNLTEGSGSRTYRQRLAETLMIRLYDESGKYTGSIVTLIIK